VKCIGNQRKETDVKYEYIVINSVVAIISLYGAADCKVFLSLNSMINSRVISVATQQSYSCVSHSERQNRSVLERL